MSLIHWDYEYNMGSIDATEERLDKVKVVPKPEVQVKYEAKWAIEQHPLMGVYQAAIAQANHGKGEERHGKGTPFLQQPWVDLAKTHGVGFLTGQADKKLREASTNIDVASNDWWEKEMLGALNYIAMAILHRKVNK